MMLLLSASLAMFGVMAFVLSKRSKGEALTDNLDKP